MASTSVVFDILARDRASDKFDHLGRSIDGSSSKMSKFTGVMKTAGKAAAYGLGAGLVLAAGAGVKFAQSAAEDAQSAELLKGALERNAGATKKQVANVEEWITAIGRAKGVADDDLRPALSRLVTATHDVGRAQMLAQVAMDVSAGTGKSLEAVSTALMKAENGQVSSLSRLGINTKLTAQEQQAMARSTVEASKGTITMEQALKTAASQTITMDEAVSRMSDTFGGAASAKAETFQGKMDRLKLMLSETGEAIGYKLIPVATKLMDWITGTGIPAVEQFTHEWQKSVGTGGQVRDVLSKIGTVVKNVAKFLWDHKVAVAAVMAAYVAFKAVMLGVQVVQAAQLVLLKAHTVGTVENKVVTLAASAASKAWAAAQWLLNAALTANPIGLVVAGIALLVGGFVLAYKKSETFREGVNKVWAALKRFAGFSLGAVVGAFAAVGDKVQWVIDKVQSLVSWIGKIHMPDVHLPSLPGNPFGRLAPGGNDTGISNPGAALIASIVKGIEKGKVKLSVVLDKLKDYIQKHKANLADLIGQRDAIVDAFKGFASSLFGADTGESAHADRLAQINDLLAQQADIRQQLADGTLDQADAEKRLADLQGKISGIQAEDSAQPRGLAALLAFQKQQRAKAEGLKADVGTLISKGISKDLLTQLQNAGEAGEEQIHLLATGTVDEIKQANEDNAATLQALQDAGLAASKAQGIEAAIAQEEANLKLADTIKGKLTELLDEQDKNTVVELYLDGHKILWSLKKIKKANGGHLGLGDKDPD